METAIVLGSVNAPFLFFVGLQFRYLFGGQANIHAAGFTYAEYARRGFGELVVVALISLGLILVLHTLGRRETPARQRGFTALSGLLIVLVLVILASAWQRLSLYEQAYGFTRLRTYAHLFIPWLGLALLVVLAFLLTHQMRRVAAAALLWGLGFGLLVGVWNVDAWVARQNVERAVSGQELDGDYLQTLSADAVPELIRQAQRPELPPAARAAVLIGLACRAAQTQPAPTPWPAFHLSQARAAQDLTALRGAVAGLSGRERHRGPLRRAGRCASLLPRCARVGLRGSPGLSPCPGVNAGAVDQPYIRPSITPPGAEAPGYTYKAP